MTNSYSLNWLILFSIQAEALQTRLRQPERGQTHYEKNSAESRSVPVLPGEDKDPSFTSKKSF
jgi:hypothetical protein